MNPRALFPAALAALLCIAVPAAAAVDRPHRKQPKVAVKKASQAKKHVRRAAGVKLLGNGGFEGSLAGWSGYRATLSLAPGAEGSRSALVRASGSGTYSIYPSPRPVRDTVAGDRYTATALFKGLAGATVCLQIREWASSAVDSAQSCVLATGAWQRFPEVDYTVEGSGHSLEAYAYGRAWAAGNSFQLDAVELATDAGPLPAPTALAASAATQTSVTLAWTPAADARVTGYRVAVDGADAGKTTGATYTVDGLGCGSAHAFAVAAVDADGDVSAQAVLTASTAACAVATPANTFYVSPSGSDSAAGTLSAPWKTIQHAAATLEPGQTALVRAGTYPDWITLAASGTQAKPIAIAAYPGERPTITGRLKITGSYTKVSGFEFVGRTSANPDSTLIYVSGADHVEISGNELTGAAMSAMFLGDEGNGSDDVHIVGNWIHDNGTHENHDHGIYYGEGDGAVIAGNLIAGNYARGIQCYPDCDDAVIANNTVVRNRRAGIQIGSDIGLASDRDLIVNNVVAYNGDTGIRAYWGAGVGAASTARNNLAYGNANGDLRGDAGLALQDNVVRDPMFVGADDYHLQAGSPARGAADPRYVPSVDLDGVAGGDSLGAYQR